MTPILWKMKPKKYTYKKGVHSCSLPVGHADVWAHYVEIGMQTMGFRNLDLARQIAMPSRRKSEKA